MANDANRDDIHAYYRKVDAVAAWEAENKVPHEDRLTYWFGDLAMDSPKYEHRDKIEGAYDRIMEAGHPLLDDVQPPVYWQTADYARAHGELEACRESTRRNAACAVAVDAAVRDGYGLEAAARSVIAEHGAGRTAWVLANAVREREGDGRLSFENRQWARAFPIPIEYKPAFALPADSVALDAFVTAARGEFENHLRAAEMSTEQNYNMLDGVINNEGPARANLTDGQTHAEIAELAPETLPTEKQPEGKASLLGKLERIKADAPPHTSPPPERGGPPERER